MASRFRRARRKITTPLVELGAWLIPGPYQFSASAVWRTSQVDYHGLDALRNAVRTQGGAVLVFCHENLLLTPYAMREFPGVALTTPVPAGTLVARILESFRYDVVRSHRRDPAGTLNELREVMHRNPGHLLALAADGPSGPRRVIKPGAAMLSQSLGLPVFTQYIGLRRYLEYPSWDKCQLPLPFNRIVMRIDQVETAPTPRTRQLHRAIQNQMDLTTRLAVDQVRKPREHAKEITPPGHRLHRP